MKLAALALLRPAQKPWSDHLLTHTRSLTIDTGGHRWLFKLKQDANFDNEICLFYRIRNFTNREAQRVKDHWTYTRIAGVTMTEWNESYKNFAFFCKPEEIMEIPTLSPKAAHKGSLLLEDSMKGRFFVKDLHIHDYGTYAYEEKDDQKTYDNFARADPASSYYGYNTNEVELNRDRKLIPNLWHKYDRSSCIAADVLNKMQQNLNIHQDARDLLNEMWVIIYLSLRMDKYEVYYFPQYVKNNKATCDRIWREWIKDKRYFPGNENNDNKIMPMYTSHEVSVQRFFAQNNLESSFYEYKVLSGRLCAVLQSSSYYEHWNTRFVNLINGCNDSVLNENERTIKDRLVQKMKRIQNNFAENMIHFKDPPLQKATSYWKDQKLYLAKELLVNENELLLKCLQLMKIPSSRLLEFCNL